MIAMLVSYPAMAKATVYTVTDVADDIDVRRMLADTVGGFTITYGVGAWSNDEGDVVTERSATIVLLHSDVSVLRRAVEAVAHRATMQLGESEVWVEIDRDVHLVKFSDRSEFGPEF